MKKSKTIKLGLEKLVFRPKILELNEKLSISLDYDTDPNKAFPVFLFVPNPKRHEHYHIELDKKATKKLLKWLESLKP
jgi:hypothetical protein